MPFHIAHYRDEGFYWDRFLLDGGGLICPNNDLGDHDNAAIKTLTLDSRMRVSGLTCCVVQSEDELACCQGLRTFESMVIWMRTDSSKGQGLK